MVQKYFSANGSGSGSHRSALALRRKPLTECLTFASLLIEQPYLPIAVTIIHIGLRVTAQQPQTWLHAPLARILITGRH